MTSVDEATIEDVVRRLRKSKPVRQPVEGGGELHIDRQLPFLCAYRVPAGEDAGTDRLVTSEASYLLAPAGGKHLAGLMKLARAVARTQVELFGSFFFLEIWADAADPKAGGPRPGFRIFAPKGAVVSTLLGDLYRQLSKVKVGGQAAEVEIDQAPRCSPPRLASILSPDDAEAIGGTVLGLAVRPIYRDRKTGEVYPEVLRSLVRRLTYALRRVFFEFTRTRTSHTPEHFHELGRRAIRSSVWRADEELDEVAKGFDFLLQVTPTNAADAWSAFERSKFQRAPTFVYRPLLVDPVVLKRRLFAAPIERVEDPALAQLFREKQDEMDRQITMLRDMNTPRFVHGSLQVFGQLSDALLAEAKGILDTLPSRTRDEARGKSIGAAAFARRARAEIEHYRRQWDGVSATVTIRDDIASGLMVSRGSLLIGKGSSTPASRVDALIQHEIGTHVVTYENGGVQPMRSLRSGLAGYDTLQEGIAVLAEYLVGGLSRPRLRLLAARVVAAKLMIDGADFVETFRHLDRALDFERKTAFTITMRIYRGGGLTKDAAYLQGLMQVLDFIKKGGDLKDLCVGKIATRHIPIVRELLLRGVLRKPPLTPRWLTRPDTRARIEELRAGATVLDLSGATVRSGSRP